MFHTDAQTIPDSSGAYMLLVELPELTHVSIGARITGGLAPGRYLYCGSANGPGGLRARIARHMRSEKKLHWHIDHLTTSGRVLGAWAWEGGDECTLVDTLGHLPHPIPGFGSTDCAVCPSHLMHWPIGVPALPIRKVKAPPVFTLPLGLGDIFPPLRP